MWVLSSGLLIHQSALQLAQPWRSHSSIGLAQALLLEKAFAK